MRAYQSGWRRALAKPDGSFGGPLDATLRSPGFARAFMALSDYVRNDSRAPADLKELVILMIAREQQCLFQWRSHVPPAAKAGLSREVIRALWDRQHPTGLTDAQAATYDALAELLAIHRMSDAAFLALKERVGEVVLIDGLGIAGYYTALAMILNVAQVGHAEPPRICRLRRLRMSCR